MKGVPVCECCGVVCSRKRNDFNLVRPMDALMGKEASLSGSYQLHHITYENIGNEGVGDLMVTCTDCHQRLESIIRRCVEKGRSRRRVMKRLSAICQRRIISTHATYGRTIGRRDAR